MGDSGLAKPTFDYETKGVFHPSVRVSDDQGGTTRSSLFTIMPGNTAPAPVIDKPVSSLTWAVGTKIRFHGHAGDAEDGAWRPSHLEADHPPLPVRLPHAQPADVSWSRFRLVHRSGPRVSVLPGAQAHGDHASGLSASKSFKLRPKTARLLFQSKPGALQLSVGTFSGTAPFKRRVIVGSAQAINAADQLLGGVPYDFSSWSDGGAAAHTITAPARAKIYTATFDPNHPPVARFSARPTEGRKPLEVRFDASRSGDPDGDRLHFSWDLDGDGMFDDSHAIHPKNVYTKHERVEVRLRVFDRRGGSDTASLTIRVKRR